MTNERILFLGNNDFKEIQKAYIVMSISYLKSINSFNEEIKEDLLTSLQDDYVKSVCYLESQDLKDYVKSFVSEMSEKNQRVILFILLTSWGDYVKFDDHKAISDSLYFPLLKNSGLVFNSAQFDTLNKTLKIFRINSYENEKYCTFFQQFLNVKLKFEDISLKKLEVFNLVKIKKVFLMEREWLNNNDVEKRRESIRKSLIEKIVNLKLINVLFLLISSESFVDVTNFYFSKEEIKDIFIEFKKKLNIVKVIKNSKHYEINSGLKKTYDIFKAEGFELFDLTDIGKIEKLYSDVLKQNKTIEKEGLIHSFVFNLNLLQNLKKTEVVLNKHSQTDKEKEFNMFSEAQLKEIEDFLKSKEAKKKLESVLNLGLRKDLADKAQIQLKEYSIALFVFGDLNKKDLKSYKEYFNELVFEFLPNVKNYLKEAIDLQYENFLRKKDILCMRSEIDNFQLRKKYQLKKH